MFSKSFYLYNLSGSQLVVGPDPEYVSGVGLQQVDVHEGLKNVDRRKTIKINNPEEGEKKADMTSAVKGLPLILSHAKCIVLLDNKQGYCSGVARDFPKGKLQTLQGIPKVL